MLIVLVKPHPPMEILDQKCPVPENYKYAWEPVVLKLIVHILKQHFPDVKTEIWHLVNTEDDTKFLQMVQKCNPNVVVFSEIDVLVSEVNRLAREVKALNPSITTIVGGKQTSLLRSGDKFPFRNIDFAFRGDGPNSLSQFVKLKIESKPICDIEGLVQVNQNGYVYGENTFSQRIYHDMVNNLEMRQINVKNHDLSEYIGRYQNHPSILSGQIKTAPIYTGVGCPYNCVFCQSPIEYGKVGKVSLSGTDKVAAEIFWLNREYGVNNFFSLEPNLNLNNLVNLYKSLENYGINYIPVSGFIRAGDIKKFANMGILKGLVEKGLRIVSIGLDIPLDTNTDIYNKSFSYNDMIECLEICEQYGIIALSTVLGDPRVTRYEFRRQLEFVKGLALAEVDVRLAIALRNTKYYEISKQFLIHNPDTDENYYQQQNYRYQTIQYPGKITPQETYEELNEFYRTFYFSDAHIEYVKRMITKHPDTVPYFKRFYSAMVINADYHKILALGIEDFELVNIK